MQAASPFTLPPESAPAPKSAGIWDFAEICLQRTVAALQEARAGTAQEISQAVARTREEHAMERPSDLLEIFARVQGHDEEFLSPAVMALGDKVAATLTPYAPYIPFAGKLIAPSAFYESFDQIHKIARVLLSPVIYAEDTDSIGIASANPVAAAILADEIRSSVFKRFGIRTFVTVARLDYESWTFLTRKHFEL
ncbi:MAG: hypothetical protein ABIS50_02250 [Luteolibacter sp.]|uniref:hypothetical protein n=1 Tax=Luteolibacter sp. TaxID=1962973 RepID=UPI0032653ED9